jgi:hypothetical protein
MNHNLDSFMKNIEKEKALRAELLALVDTYVQRTNASKTPVPNHVHTILVDALAAGYGIWRNSFDKDDKSNPFFLQKCIRNNQGHKLYFINMQFWDIGREFPDYNTEGHGAVNLSPNGQFYVGERRGDHARTVDVSAHLRPVDTLVSIEEFFASFYDKMGCVPYEDD